MGGAARMLWVVHYCLYVVVCYWAVCMVQSFQESGYLTKCQRTATQGSLAICCGTTKLNLDFAGPSCDILHYVHNLSQSSESENIRNQGSLCKEPQPSFHYRLITELHRRRNLFFGEKTIYFDATSPAWSHIHTHIHKMCPFKRAIRLADQLTLSYKSSKHLKVSNLPIPISPSLEWK